MIPETPMAGIVGLLLGFIAARLHLRGWDRSAKSVICLMAVLYFFWVSYVVSRAQEIVYVQTPVRKEIDYNGWKVSRDDSYGKPGVYVTLSNGRQVRFEPDARSAYIVEWVAGEMGGKVVQPTQRPFALKPSARPDDPQVSAVADARLVKYKRAEYTQSLSRIAFNYDPRFRIIQAVHRSRLERKWHQSGGMEGITGYRSEIFGPKDKTEAVQTMLPVFNGSNDQLEYGWARSYPDGTRFEDRLTNTETGKLFELRVAEKRDGKWIRRVVFKDEKQRPKGYVGLTVTCSSCHDLAGTGGYATGLVPGSDTVLSDPVPALETEALTKQ